MAVTEAPGATTPLDVERIRADFPVLSRTVHGKQVVYLDNPVSLTIAD
jgi:cysteine desulfurase/selenocysteine lyase